MPDAYLTDRNFIVCELDAEYVKKATGRLKRVMQSEVDFSALINKLIYFHDRIL